MGSRNSIFWTTPPPSPFTPTHNPQTPISGEDEEPSPVSRKSSLDENVNPFAHSSSSSSSPCRSKREKKCHNDNKKEPSIDNLDRRKAPVAGLGIRLQKPGDEAVKCVDVKLIQGVYHIDLSTPIASQVFTKVYGGTLTSTAQQLETPVVFKVADMATVMHEARVLTYLSENRTTDANIVGFQGVIDSLPALVLDRYPMDLSQYIESKFIACLSENTRQDCCCPIIGLRVWKTVALSLLRALSYLRRKHVIHSDIKTDNVFMQPQQHPIEVVLGDFSSANLMGYVYGSGSVHDRTTSTYAAPELLTIPPQPATYSSDLFAVGLVLLQAATGVAPYSGAIKSPSQRLIWAQRGLPLDCLSDTAMSRISNPSVRNILDMCLVERADVDHILASISL